MITHKVLYALAGLSVVWTALLVLLASDAGIDVIQALIAPVVTAILAGAGLLCDLSTMPSRGRPERVLLWSLPAWCTAGVLAVFLGSQSPWNPLFRLRFIVSEGAMSHEAHVASSSEIDSTSRWVGLFHVTRVERYDDEIRFITGMCGVIDQCGFVFRNHPPPANLHKTKLRHLEGHWYHLYDVF
jgi:hypothetical protein